MIPFLLYHNIEPFVQVFHRELGAWCQKQSDRTPFALIDVGGGDGSNITELLSLFPMEFEVHIMDLEENEKNHRHISFDITGELDSSMEKKFDIVYSFNAFEHFNNPIVAADNCAKLVKPGGIVIIHTVFSWRYHPVPKDYFRFTDDALRYLFAERNALRTVACGYDIDMRRTDIRGGYFGDRDVPPIDELGGWRENWGVFYVGVDPFSSSN